MTDQQIDEFLEMLAKSPTSARDIVRGMFAAHEAKAAPAVPLELCPTCGEDRPFSGTCGTSDSDTNALCKRKCKPSQPVALTDEEANAIKLTSWTDEENYGAKFCDGFNAGVNAIIAALREKEARK